MKKSKKQPLSNSTQRLTLCQESLEPIEKLKTKLNLGISFSFHMSTYICIYREGNLKKDIRKGSTTFNRIQLLN